MALERPFDDARWPDRDGHAECFLCGRRVDPLDKHRGSYEESPAGPALPIHLPCLNDYTDRPEIANMLYHIAINDMGRHVTPMAN